MEFEVVVAADEQGGVGSRGRIPWHLAGDLARFRELTTGSGSNAVVMGRITWESLPSRRQPLPQRLNVVLTRNPTQPLPAAVLRFATFEGALADLHARQLEGSVHRVFVIGGASLFLQALQRPECRRVHLTRVLGSFDCDVHLPPLPARFARTWTSELQCDEGQRYRFETHDG